MGDSNPRKAKTDLVSGGDPGTTTGGTTTTGGNGNTMTVKQQAPDVDIDDVNAQLENAGNSYNNEIDRITKADKAARGNIQDQRKANAKQLLMKKNQINRKSDWQPNQQKEQSTYAALRRTMGNAAYGSGLADLNEGMRRYDDMQDKELIETWKDNQNNAYNNWYQANADLIADYNTQVAKTNDDFAAAYDNYMGNIANINSQLGKQLYGYSDNQEQLTSDINKAKSLSKSANANLKSIKAVQAAQTNVTSISKQIKELQKKKNPTIADKNKLTKLQEKLSNGKTILATAQSANKVKAVAKIGNKSYNLATAEGKKAYSKAIKKAAKGTKKITVSKALNKAVKKATKTANNKAAALKKAKTAEKDARVLSTEVNEGADKIGVTAQQERFSGLSKLENKASLNNPNIPGAGDYIRGDKEDVASAKKANNSMTQTYSKTTTSTSGLKVDKNFKVSGGEKTTKNYANVTKGASGVSLGGNANTREFQNTLTKGGETLAKDKIKNNQVQSSSTVKTKARKTAEKQASKAKSAAQTQAKAVKVAKQAKATVKQAVKTGDKKKISSAKNNLSKAKKAQKTATKNATKTSKTLNKTVKSNKKAKFSTTKKYKSIAKNKTVSKTKK